MVTLLAWAFDGPLLPLGISCCAAIVAVSPTTAHMTKATFRESMIAPYLNSPGVFPSSAVFAAPGFTCEASTHCCRSLDSTSLGQRAAAAQLPDDKQHEGDDQQHMNDGADRERPDEAQQPGDQENDGDGVQHGDFSLLGARSSHARLHGAEAIHDPTPLSMPH